MYRYNYPNMYNVEMQGDTNTLPVYKIGVNQPSLANSNLNIVNSAAKSKESGLDIGNMSNLASSLLGGMKSDGETSRGLDVGNVSNILGSLSSSNKNNKDSAHDWGNTLGSAASGAATGFASGGPLGALVGALIGAGSSFLGDL